MLDVIDQNHSRDFILNIHLLVHNQLTADAFISMTQYAWFKSDYNVPDPGKFKNVREIYVLIPKICSKFVVDAKKQCLLVVLTVINSFV